MKRYNHFFGCSFTAGDEVADNIYFPWAADCKDPTEYQNKKNKSFETKQVDLLAYRESCKKYAYPSFLNDGLNESFNHAECGASLSANIYKILKLVEDESIKKDAIFLQIPPPGRVHYFENDSVFSFPLGFNGRNYTEFDDFRLNYLKHFDPIREDFLDIQLLLLLTYYLEEKSINYYVLDLNSELFNRLEILSKNFLWMVNLFKCKITNLITLPTLQVSPLTRSIGGHFTSESHKIIADIVKNKTHYFK